MIDSVEKWDFSLSHPGLLFSDNDKRVKWLSDGFLIPAALALLPSRNCCLTLKIENVPYKKGSISFGLSTLAFPSAGSDEFGKKSDSWGIRSNRNDMSDSIIATSGVWVSSYRALEKGDVIRMQVDLDDSIAVLVINNVDIHRFKIPRGNSTDYVLGCTLCHHCEFVILSDRPPANPPSDIIALVDNQILSAIQQEQKKKRQRPSSAVLTRKDHHDANSSFKEKERPKSAGAIRLTSPGYQMHAPSENALTSPEDSAVTFSREQVEDLIKKVLIASKRDARLRQQLLAEENYNEDDDVIDDDQHERDSRGIYSNNNVSKKSKKARRRSKRAPLVRADVRNTTIKGKAKTHLNGEPYMLQAAGDHTDVALVLEANGAAKPVPTMRARPSSASLSIRANNNTTPAPSNPAPQRHFADEVSIRDAKRYYEKLKPLFEPGKVPILPGVNKIVDPRMTVTHMTTNDPAISYSRSHELDVQKKRTKAPRDKAMAALGDNLVLRISIEKEISGSLKRHANLATKTIPIGSPLSSIQDILNSKLGGTNHANEDAFSVAMGTIAGSTDGEVPDKLLRSQSTPLPGADGPHNQTTNAPVIMNRSQSVVDNVMNVVALSAARTLSSHMQSAIPLKRPSSPLRRTYSGISSDKVYTKDGRLVQLTEEEKNERDLKLAQLEEKRRQKMKENKLKDLGQFRPPSPPQLMRRREKSEVYEPIKTEPNWPGHHIGSSTVKWVERMRQLATERNAPPPEPEVKPKGERPPALHWPNVYDSMSACDLVLSIEHCCQCTDHTSLR